MKTLRLASLLVVAGIVLLNPRVVLSDPSACCPAFELHCEAFCEAHEGVLVTNCYGFYCTEFCYCGDDTSDEHAGGTYCPPCVE